MSSAATEYHIEVIEEQADPVELLATASGLSKQKIKQAMQKGAVWISDSTGTRRLRRQSKKLGSDHTLHLYYDTTVLDEVVADAVLIADEGDYSVWYKPRGMRSQGSKWSDHCAINRWVEQHLQPERPAFIVHRLDRFASGLILIAHKKKTAQYLSGLFEKKHITKEYKVIVHGKFPVERVTYNNPVDNKPATSHATLLQYDAIKDQSLLRVEIETGRKHQIRRHLSEAGYPVVGDRAYSGDQQGDLQLTAYLISFASPLDGSEKIYLLPGEYQPKLEN